MYDYVNITGSYLLDLWSSICSVCLIIFHFKFIVERRENSKTDVNGIGNAEQLLNYLDGKYFLFNNVFYLQGLFLASQAPELYDICVEYAKAEVNKVTFFEKKILDEGKDVKLCMHFLKRI